MRRRSVLKGLVAASAVTSAFSHLSSPVRAAAGVAHHKVEIKGFKFDPEVLPVKPGDRITWTNADIVEHTATAEDGSWDTGSIEPAQSQTLEVSEGMSAEYICAFHPSMVGKLSL